MQADNGERRRSYDIQFETVNQAMAEIRQQIRELSQRLEEMSRQVRSDISQLQFVRLDVYAESRAAMKDDIKNAKDTADSAKKSANTILATLISAFIITLFGLAVRLALG